MKPKKKTSILKKIKVKKLQLKEWESNLIGKKKLKEDEIVKKIILKINSNKTNNNKKNRNQI
jgi:hypothetical protein